MSGAHCADHIGMEPMKPGRPAKFDSHSALLLACIRTGMRPTTARRKAQVSGTTVRRWITAGQDAELLAAEGVPLTDDEAKYRRFLASYQQACVDLQAKLEQRLTSLVPDMDTRELLSVLERVDREVWGKHDQVTVHSSGSDLQAVVMDRWAETIGILIRRVLNDCHLSDEQAIMAKESLTRHLATMSVDGDDGGSVEV